MANWIKVNVEMYRREDAEDQVRLRDLGVESEEEIQTEYNAIMLDADKVISYAPLYGKEGIEEGKSEVVLDNDRYMILGISFKELDKLIRKHG